MQNLLESYKDYGEDLNKNISVITKIYPNDFSSYIYDIIKKHIEELDEKISHVLIHTPLKTMRESQRVHLLKKKHTPNVKLVFVTLILIKYNIL